MFISNADSLMDYRCHKGPLSKRYGTLYGFINVTDALGCLIAGSLTLGPIVA